jgi:hypothetical protein
LKKSKRTWRSHNLEHISSNFRFIFKGYVLLFCCIFLTCKHEEEQAARSISFA